MVGIAVVIVSAVCACAPARVRSDPSLAGKIEPLLNSAVPTRLADVAAFDWDRVYLFEGYTQSGEIKSIVGGDVLDTPWVPESEILLVFDSNGRPVRVASMGAFVFPADNLQVPHGWSRNAVLEPKCRLLWLHEPGQPGPPDDCSK